MRYQAIADLATAKANPPGGRRLSDKIFVAFHQACDQADFEVAEQLIGVLETIATREAPLNDGRRRDREGLVAAYERLWYLRHPTAGDQTMQ